MDFCIKHAGLKASQIMDKNTESQRITFMCLPALVSHSGIGGHVSGSVFYR